MRGGDRFEANYSPWRLLLLSLLSFLFVLAGLWMVGTFGDVPESRRFSPEVAFVAGWACILFFGPIGVWMIWKALSGGVAIRVDNYGIQDMRISKQPFPWESIERIGTYSMGANKFVGLTVRNPESFGLSMLASKSAGVNEGMTGFPFAVGTPGTDKSHQELFAAIDRFCPPGDYS